MIAQIWAVIQVLIRLFGLVDLIQNWLEARRLKANAENDQARDKAADNLKNAKTEDEFDKAQDDIVNHRP